MILGASIKKAGSAAHALSSVEPEPKAQLKDQSLSSSPAQLSWTLDLCTEKWTLLLKKVSSNFFWVLDELGGQIVLRIHSESQIFRIF